jgi:non-heme chloroperoxidase
LGAYTVSDRELYIIALVAALDLWDARHVGHATGGGEVAGEIGRHGTQRVAKAVLIGAVPPVMVQTPAHPGGLPMDAFDQIRVGCVAVRCKGLSTASGKING